MAVGCSAESDNASTDSDDVVGGKLDASNPAVGYLANGSSPDFLFGPNCGVTLIEPDLAVTAAHCIDSTDKAAFGMGFGKPEERNIIPAKSVMLHPLRTKISQGAGKERFRYDIAILRLARPANVTPLSAGIPKNNAQTLYIGYGRTTTGSYSVSDGYTNERKSSDFMVTNIDNTSIYASGINGGNCWGDSGGPLLDTQTKGVLGVLADFDGVFNCHVGNAMIYTSLDGAKDFIADAKACDTGPDGFIGILPGSCRSDIVPPDETKLIQSGRYNELHIGVDGTIIRGVMRKVIGNPDRDGVKCELSFTGVENGTGRVAINVTDGATTTQGELISSGTETSVSIRLPQLSLACSRTYSARQLGAANGQLFQRTGELPLDTAAFRMVKAEKAFFYDAPNGARRNSYVLRGDSLEQLGETEGYARVRYTGVTGRVTVGFMREIDLVPDVD